MRLTLPANLLAEIHRHGEAAFPDEGAGFLLGKDGDPRQVVALLSLDNIRQGEARRTRYLISPQDYLKAEDEADRAGLMVVGVFHSHPDSPNQPSIYDRDWAQPWFSYIITSIYTGKAVESRSWRLADDRSGFTEEAITIQEEKKLTTKNTNDTNKERK